MRIIEIIFALFAGVIILFSSTIRVVVSHELNVVHIHLDSVHKIIDVTDSVVVPVLYDSLIVQSFKAKEVRKKQFINQVLPAILIVRYNMQLRSEKVEKIIYNLSQDIPILPKEQFYIDSLMKKYRAINYDNLISRLKPHPTSLVLAQAAVESGWGSSRFAMEGNNLFGVWTTKNDPNVIKSLYDREEQSIFLKKYSSIAESVDHYFLTIGRHRAYTQFRKIRNQEVDVFQLIKALDSYSERGDEYTYLLRKMIEWNDLQKYDSYTISEDYFTTTTKWDKIIKRLKTYNGKFKT